ncbi:MAG: C13 family peptidase, partial [Desulfococcaceae bacterium]|nr:C13 family peptidase [Desulfococcaceae bacterium]
GVCWSTSQNPINSDSKTSDGTGTGSFTSSITDLTANTTYYMRSYAINSAGTGYGNQVSFTTLAPSDTTPPTAPTYKSSAPSTNTWTNDNTVTVSWNAGTDSESGVAGYSYVFDTSASTVPDNTVETAQTQITGPALPDGGSHYFHIRTVDRAGNASTALHTGPFKIDTLPPTGSITVNSNAASTSSQSVILSISAADSGSGLSQMAFSNDNVNWSSPVPYAASADWTLSSGLGIKTVYARFSDILGNRTSISITDSITLESVPGPNTPTGLRATSGSHAVTLQWDEPLSPETEGYHIYRSDAENGFYVQLTSDPHYNPDYNENERKWYQVFTDENLINGLEYWYKITAVSSGSESDATAPVSAVPAALIGGDFRLELMETSGMVAAGDSIVFHITVIGEDRFAEAVSLSATGSLPSGISKTFTGNPVKPTGMAALRLDIPYSAAPGDYTFTINGISENRSHHSKCGLKIVNIAIGQGRITALPQKESYRLGEKAEIYGQLLPWQVSGTAVTVQVRKSGELQWTSSPAVIGENSAFRFSYLPQQTGEYEVRASWVGNAYVAACESEISAFTVTRGKSEIRVTTSDENPPEPGDTVSIGIELSSPYEGEPLYFEILKPGLNVPETVEGLFTQSQGKRSFNYTLEENLPGIWKFKAAWGGNEDYTGSVSLPLVLYPGIEVGHALILAGGGMDQNTLWKTTEFLCNRFYQILQKRRFDHDQIYYISDFTHNYDLNGDDIDDIIVDEHSPSVGIVQNYLENLYRPGQEPLVGANRPLILYLADHGGVGQFKINAGEYLKAADLDTWLDALQTATGCRIVIIAEACHSGTFIEKLLPTGDQQRILISSSNTEVANYDQDGIQSFSRFFFDQVAQGDSLRNCFFKARKEMGN